MDQARSSTYDRVKSIVNMFLAISGTVVLVFSLAMLFVVGFTSYEIGTHTALRVLIQTVPFSLLFCLITLSLKNKLGMGTFISYLVASATLYVLYFLLSGYVLNGEINKISIGEIFYFYSIFAFLLAPSFLPMIFYALYIRK